MSMNVVAIQGRLTRDPELRKTQSDVSVVNFSLAVERDFKDRESGERQADFFDVTAWRYTADFVSSYFHKGDMALVHGRLQNNRYTDREGNNRVKIEVQADNVYFCGPRSNGGGAYSSGMEEKKESAAQQYGEDGEQGKLGGFENGNGFADVTDTADDDLPF